MLIELKKDKSKLLRYNEKRRCYVLLLFHVAEEAPLNVGLTSFCFCHVWPDPVDPVTVMWLMWLD